MSEECRIRPRLGVSACLLGQAVRYDGAHKHTPWIVEVLGAHVAWFALCPEVGVGMGVPRPPIHLQREVEGAVSLVGVGGAPDHTAAMHTWATAQLGSALPRIDGWVLKARSPSCGVDDAALHDPDGEVLGHRDGLFAAYVASHSEAPRVTEAQLADPGQRRVFLRAIFSAVERSVPEALREDAPGLGLDP